MPIHEGLLTHIEVAIANDVVGLTCEMGPVRVHARVPLDPDWEEIMGLLNSAFDQQRRVVITYDVVEGTNRLLSVWAPGSRIQGVKHVLVWNLAGPLDSEPFYFDTIEASPDSKPALTWKQRILGSLARRSDDTTR